MDATHHESGEKDINDVFDNIAFSEEQISSKAFLEGLIKGQKDGKFEGYHLGFHRGLELGTEIGFYEGLTKVLLRSISETRNKKYEKIVSLLEKLSDLLNSFPEHNSEDVDLQKAINEIRTNFKKLNSLLKLNIPFPITTEISF